MKFMLSEVGFFWNYILRWKLTSIGRTLLGSAPMEGKEAALKRKLGYNAVLAEASVNPKGV